MDAAHLNFMEWRPTLPTVECVQRESKRYQVPVEVTLGLMLTEGGKPGMLKRNTNGSHDMGVMQVNTIWLSEYSKKTNIPPHVLRHMAVNNGCFSVSFGLDILRRHMDRERSIARAVAAYHSRTPHLGDAYLKRFERSLGHIRQGKFPALAGR